jgi:hypothetical protein
MGLAAGVDCPGRLARELWALLHTPAPDRTAITAGYAGSPPL